MAIAKALPIVEAFTLATVTPALVMAASGSPGLFAPTLIVSAAHAVFFGVPVFWVLRAHGRVNLATAVGAGFLIGLVPFALSQLPEPAAGSSASDSLYGETVINGVRTAAGWRQYRDSALLFGGFGALAGFVFGSYLWARSKLR